MDEQVWCRIAAALPNDLITRQLCDDLHDAEEDWRKVTRELEWERREWPKQLAFALGLPSIVERTPSMVAMRVDAIRAENSRLAARVAELEGLINEELSDRQRTALRELRGGCACHISPPCSCCCEPLTLEEVQSLSAIAGKEVGGA
jgi:hypothetical protein